MVNNLGEIEPELAEATAVSEASVSATDRHVGERVRNRRVSLGLTQQQFADLIGVTYQQAFKYERGINRISAGRLFDIANVLDTPIAWFFEDIAQEGHDLVRPRHKAALELARNFAAIDDEKHREALVGMAKTLAEQARRRNGDMGE